MLIIPEPNSQKSQVRLRLSVEIVKEIEDYIEWAGIKSKDYFIEQACKYIFNHDDDWKKFKAG